MKSKQLLCKWCCKREGTKFQIRSRATSNNCLICKGSFERLPELAKSALAELRSYQFRTFLVGSSISQDLIEADDEFRAKFKIAGRQSMKSQISHYVSRFLARETGRRIDHSKPDITILVTVPSSSVLLSPRSIWISAYYRKTKRGIGQRSSVCRVCNGVGCAVCAYKGASSETLQQMATSYFVDLFRAEGCNFIWVGNEDEQSLVKAKGRPFFIEVVRPRRRPLLRSGPRGRGLRQTLPNRVAFNGITLTSIRALDSKPTEIPQLETRCRVYLKWKEKSMADWASLVGIREAIEHEFVDKEVRIRLSKRFKTINRKVSYVRLDPAPEENEDGLACTLDMLAEGGLPIRKFVFGSDEEVFPNLSKFVVNMMLDPLRPFDVIEIHPKTARPEEKIASARSIDDTRLLRRSVPA